MFLSVPEPSTCPRMVECPDKLTLLVVNTLTVYVLLREQVILVKDYRSAYCECESTKVFPSEMFSNFVKY